MVQLVVSNYLSEGCGFDYLIGWVCWWWQKWPLTRFQVFVMAPRDALTVSDSRYITEVLLQAHQICQNACTTKRPNSFIVSLLQEIVLNPLPNTVTRFLWIKRKEPLKIHSNPFNTHWITWRPVVYFLKFGWFWYVMQTIIKSWILHVLWKTLKTTVRFYGFKSTDVPWKEGRSKYWKHWITSGSRNVYSLWTHANTVPFWPFGLYMHDCHRQINNPKLLVNIQNLRHALIKVEHI